MKNKLVLLIILISTVVMGCEKQDKEPEKPQPPATEQETKTENKTSTEPEQELPVAADCFVNNFFEGISFLSDNADVYLVKGEVLDNIEYGLSIKFIEDLKGNFPLSTGVFTVWGGDNQIITLERTDRLSLYETGDILIMHIEKSPDVSSWGFSEEDMRLWIEKPDDYTTIPCTSSVVKLSDGYVTGAVFSGIDKLSLDEFQQKLNESLTK